MVGTWCRITTATLDVVALAIAGSHNGLIILLMNLFFWCLSHRTDWLRHCLRALPEDTLLLGEWVHAIACRHHAVSVVLADVWTPR